ncbi:MAG: hypothetical protein KC620_02915, partial [Myxococcales bacterium]|nr:hypothetical protein [Myxococcales bacterium]
IKVRFPWLDDRVESHWARVVCFYAGPDRGGYIMPEVGDEVLLMFERDDPSAAYVVGSLWNGEDTIPGPGNPDGENNTKWWQSRCGHKFIFEDKEGAEKITLVDKSGNLKIVIDVPQDRITMEATTGDIFFKAPAGPINIESKTMTIQASNSSTVQVGNGLNEVSKNRSETVGVSCSATASATWQVGTKTLTMSFGSAEMSAASGTMVVSGASTQTIGSSKFEGNTVHRNSGPETLLAGSLEMHAKDFQLVLEGPATVIGGSVQVTSKADVTVQSGSLLTVMGGLINYSGGSSITNQASLVTLC